MTSPSRRHSCGGTRHMAIGLIVSAILAGGAMAHTGATGVVKQRMELMQDLGGAMKVLIAMVRDATAFDADRALVAAGTIANHGGARMIALFPEGSMQAPSDALPEIWTNRDAFGALARRLEADANTLSSAIARDPVGIPRTAFSAVARDCAACHKDFRQTRK